MNFTILPIKYATELTEKATKGAEIIGIILAYSIIVFMIYLLIALVIALYKEKKNKDKYMKKLIETNQIEKIKTIEEWKQCEVNGLFPFINKKGKE